MNNREKMLHHLAEAEKANLLVEEIEKVIDREVTRRHGNTLLRADSRQEQENLRLSYTKQLAKENLWLQRQEGRRAFHVAMAQMYGTATLVDQGRAHWDVGLD